MKEASRRVSAEASLGDRCCSRDGRGVESAGSRADGARGDHGVVAWGTSEVAGLAPSAGVPYAEGWV
jgi:hypothetical protein